MKHRVTLFLTICLVAAASFVFAQTPEQPENYGDPEAGTVINPYEIASWENLYWLSQNSDYWDAHFIQTDHIDFEDASPPIREWDDEKGWRPIGRQCPAGDEENDRPFEGVYNGDGYSIIGLFSDRQGGGPDDPGGDEPPEVCPDNSTALFGYIVDADIRNLHLEDVEIYATEGAASLVTFAVNSTIENVSANGQVNGVFLVGGLFGVADGCNIINASSAADVIGAAYLGGLVGLSFNSDFEKSTATGDVTGVIFEDGPIFLWSNAGERLSDVFSGSERVNRFISNVNNRDNGPGEPIFPFSGFLVGGFAGLLDTGTIERSSSSGDVQGGFGVGGFAGVADRISVTESFSTSNVAGGVEGAGGFAGIVFSTEINNSYHRGDVSGDEFVGGFIGGVEGPATITFSYSAGAVTGNSKVNGFVGDVSNGDNLLIENSFWDVDTDGISGTSSGDENEGAIGRSTLEMQSIFNFEDVDWSIQEDPDLPRDYPLLTWQLDTNSPLWTLGSGDPPAIPFSGWSIWITLLLMSFFSVRIALRKLL